MKGGYDRKKPDEKPFLKRGISMSDVKEDAAVNCAGSGAIAGIGTGPYPNSEPGVPKKRLKVILNNAKMLTRKAPK